MTTTPSEPTQTEETGSAGPEVAAQEATEAIDTAEPEANAQAISRRMIGSAQEEGEFGAKVVVLKALGGNPRHSYFALLTQGFPRLVTVSQDALTQEEAGQAIEGVLMHVRLRDEDAVIPDLAAIEARIAEIDALRAA